MEPVSVLCAHPTTPHGKGASRRLRAKVAPGPRLALAPSSSLHGRSSLLYTVLSLSRPVPAVSEVWPAMVVKDLGRLHAPLQWPAADSLPAPFLGLPLPASAYLGHTEGESLVPVGLAEAGATERAGHQSPSAALQSHLLGQSSSGPESRALGCPSEPPLPDSVSPLGRRSHVFAVTVTTRSISSFGAALHVRV